MECTCEAVYMCVYPCTMPGELTLIPTLDGFEHAAGPRSDSIRFVVEPRSFRLAAVQHFANGYGRSRLPECVTHP